MRANLLTAKQQGVVATIEEGPYSTRLMSLGIRKGAIIQKLRSTTGGGILFRVEDHRVVLHKNLAASIEVREEL